MSEFPSIVAKPLAVLIDADNASPKVISSVLAEVATYGTASIKRIYGDWTKPNLGSWKDLLLALSIQPIQQFANTKGKNSTDSAMIIDAMDLLYTGRFSGFCLVTSDSDFTRLAARIREQGLTVYGFGEKKTPEAFRVACDRFVFTEILNPEDQAGYESGKVSTNQKASREKLLQDTELVHLIRQAVEKALGEEREWALLSAVGYRLLQLRPDFSPRNYGYAKLVDLIEAMNLFEVGRTGQDVLVRPKPSKG